MSDEHRGRGGMSADLGIIRAAKKDNYSQTYQYLGLNYAKKDGAWYCVHMLPSMNYEVTDPIIIAHLDVLAGA